MITWIILAAITLFCIIVHPLQKSKGLSWERTNTTWGSF